MTPSLSARSRRHICTAQGSRPHNRERFLRNRCGPPALCGPYVPHLKPHPSPMQLTWRLSRAQSSPALGTASKRCVARPADPARPHSPLSTAHACPPRHAQTCNFDVLYACAAARLEPGRLPCPSRELHRSPVTHTHCAQVPHVHQLRLLVRSREEPVRTAGVKPRPPPRIAARAPTHAPTHTPPRRPKRNIKTAMNHEILLYGAQPRHKAHTPHP